MWLNFPSFSYCLSHDRGPTLAMRYRCKILKQLGIRRRCSLNPLNLELRSAHAFVGLTSEFTSLRGFSRRSGGMMGSALHRNLPSNARSCSALMMIPKLFGIPAIDTAFC